MGRWVTGTEFQDQVVIVFAKSSPFLLLYERILVQFLDFIFLREKEDGTLELYYYLSAYCLNFPNGQDLNCWLGTNEVLNFCCA